MLNNKYILNRPINALKKVYFPSYLASKIRGFGRSDLYSRVLEKSIKKKLHSSEDWAYKENLVFKGVASNGEIEFRRFLSPSPSTSSAEAYIINDISELFSQIKSKRVYSHVISSKYSNSNFEYYYNFYEKRNNEILKAMNDGLGKVAVFFDIKDFYNSIDVDYLYSKLDNHPIFSCEDGASYLNFMKHQISIYKKGVPIGTDLSHVMADIFLEGFDKKLELKYGSNYFRYVDDITIVCQPADVDKCRDFICQELAELGLNLNLDKFDIISLDEWAEIVEVKAVEGQDFYSLCEKINHWISGERSKIDWLSEEFNNLGFQMPMRKISSLVTPYNLADDIFENEREIIKSIIDVRNSYKYSLERIAENIHKEDSRWFFQKVKKTINPLFYLLSNEDYGIITNVASLNNKLKNQYELSDAMHKSDCSSLVKYPGSAVNAFCEIWMENNKNFRKIAFNPDVKNKNIYESASILAMFGIVDPSAEMCELPLWKALKPNITKATEGLPLFESEIESLRIGVSEHLQKEFLLSKYNSGEDINFDALDLGDQEISG